MIKTTRWSPDTCECVVEYEWDTEQLVTSRSHTGKNVVTACPRHSAPTPDAHFNVVVNDNKLKNDALKVLVANYPQLSITDEDGDTKLDRSKIQFYLNMERILELTISDTDLSVVEKTEAISLIEAEVGDVGRVIFM